MIFGKLGSLLRGIQDEVQVYQLILNHPGVPKSAKVLLGIGIAYLISPIDLIPDFIPFIGYLDDLLIVPTCVLLALAIIPKEIVEECRSIVKLTSPPV